MSERGVLNYRLAEFRITVRAGQGASLQLDQVRKNCVFLFLLLSHFCSRNQTIVLFLSSPLLCSGEVSEAGSAAARSHNLGLAPSGM